MKTVAIALLMAVLTGCAATQTVTVPKEVKVQVPTACIDPKDREKLEPPKVRTDAELRAMDSYQWAIAVWVDRIELQIYKDKAAAAIEACSKIPAPKLRAGN